MSGNTPRPLRNAPIALLADERSQMSFGERAALEGVLAQLWPKLAVEVGSAAGGSLQRIAAYSDEVHSFDLTLPDNDVTVPKHVIPHTGDSHDLLPRWLDGMEGRRIDFAFVDGDHSVEGVRADLSDLLDSSTTRCTVILVHDTANLGVREGVAFAFTGANPRIVYHEIDFVAGYQFAEGPFSGEYWGGLGLIVTGNPNADGYCDNSAQTLYRKRSF